MRKILFAAIIVTFVLIRPAQAQDFDYPADGEAWYSIRTNFPDTSAVGQGLWTIKTVAVNGTRARDFAVFQGGKEMPGTEIDGGRAFELKVRLAFLANLKPREKATYLVFYNNPGAKKAAVKSDLRVTGRGLAKTIENDFYKAVLHPKSGTIYEVYEKSTRTKLEHKLETNGSVHWNPDVYAPPHAWYHCSDWENPAFSEDAGPVFYSLRREAPLPLPKGIQVSITYYFYAGTPFILTESLMEIQNDIFVESLRNAEIVFNKAVFDKAAFKTVDGRFQTLDFASSRMHPKHAAVLRPDTPWVSFYNEAKGIGFASLFLDMALPNRHGGEASQQQPYIYIQHGLWYYMSRGFVYSFGSNNQTRLLPVKAGSLYYDKNAWLPFGFKKDRGFDDMLDRTYNMLKYPLGIMDDIETFAESPDGWIVPILTEPFEEGVKGAIGGPKKK